MRRDYLTTADRDQLRQKPTIEGERPSGFLVRDTPEYVAMIARCERLDNLRRRMMQYQGGFIRLAADVVAATEAEIADLESQRTPAEIESDRIVAKMRRDAD